MLLVFLRRRWLLLLHLLEFQLILEFLEGLLVQLVQCCLQSPQLLRGPLLPLVQCYQRRQNFPAFQLVLLILLDQSNQRCLELLRVLLVPEVLLVQLVQEIPLVQLGREIPLVQLGRNLRYFRNRR